MDFSIERKSAGDIMADRQGRAFNRGGLPMVVRWRQVAPFHCHVSVLIAPFSRSPPCMMTRPRAASKTMPWLRRGPGTVAGWMRVQVDPSHTREDVWQKLIDSVTTRYANLEQLDDVLNRLNQSSGPGAADALA